MRDSRVRRTLVRVAVCAAIHVSAVSAQAPASFAGRWEGVLQLPGSVPLRILLALDSSVASEWKGTVVLPSQRLEPQVLGSIVRTRDSLEVHLSPKPTDAVLHLVMSPTGLAGSVIAGAARGTVTLLAAGSAGVAPLVAPAVRVERSRQAASRLSQTPPPVHPPTSNPDSSLIVTSDIPRFWSILDRAPADSLGAYLERDYLAPGSLGLRDFINGRIQSGEDLAFFVQTNRARYDSVRAAKLDIASAERDIRVAFHKLAAAYPPAVFPDVYFVIGRFNSGGTASPHGQIIGAEMFRTAARLPSIVSHELIHSQQHANTRTLLAGSFNEGAADFIGELISGIPFDGPRVAYGLAHEGALWKEFSAHFDDTNFFPWMYGTPPDGRPADLGYFIGYRIARAYYEKMVDKRQAIADIITARNGNVRELLAMSGYAPTP